MDRQKITGKVRLAESDAIADPFEKVWVWQAIAIALVERDRGSRAFAVARDMAGLRSAQNPLRQVTFFEIQMQALQEAALALAAAGDSDRARRVAAIATEIPTPAIDETTVASGESPEARLAWLRRQIVLETESAIATAAFERGKTDTAEAAIAAQVPKFSNSPLGLVLLARAFARVGNAERALAIAREIRDEGMQDFALSNVAIALSEAGKSDRALQLLPEIASDTNRLEALSAIVPELTDTDDLNRAVAIARGLEIESWRNEGVALAVVRFVALGEGEAAMRLANDNHSREVWLALVEGLVAAGETDRLVASATSADIALPNDVRVALVRGASELGAWDAAIALAETFPTPETRARMLAIAAEHLSGRSSARGR